MLQALSIFRCEEIRGSDIVETERHSTWRPGASPPSRTMSILPNVPTISGPGTAFGSGVRSATTRHRKRFAMLGKLPSQRRPSVSLASEICAPSGFLLGVWACRSVRVDSPRVVRAFLRRRRITRMSEIPAAPGRRMRSCCAPESRRCSPTNFFKDRTRGARSLPRPATGWPTGFGKSSGSEHRKR